MSFEGQRVVVIGASAGIGEVTARSFAAAGAAVTVTGRAKDRLDAAAERIGYPVETHELDATDAAAVAGFFAGIDTVDHLVLPPAPARWASGHSPTWTRRRCARRSRASSSRTSRC
jgi:NADP-dependent 3-hydroxy acid dehydrogenase YdfG